MLHDNSRWLITIITSPTHLAFVVRTEFSSWLSKEAKNPSQTSKEDRSSQRFKQANTFHSNKILWRNFRYKWHVVTLNMSRLKSHDCSKLSIMYVYLRTHTHTRTRTHRTYIRAHTQTLYGTRSSTHTLSLNQSFGDKMALTSSGYRCQVEWVGWEGLLWRKKSQRYDALTDTQRDGMNKIKKQQHVTDAERENRMGR